MQYQDVFKFFFLVPIYTNVRIIWMVAIKGAYVTEAPNSKGYSTVGQVRVAGTPRNGADQSLASSG